MATGNAELGFVALSQVTTAATISIATGSIWTVPQNLYNLIEQQAVLLRETEAARKFLEYMRSDEARAVIRDHGYETP